MMGTPNFGGNKSVAGDFLGGMARNPEVQGALATMLMGLLSSLVTGLIAKIGQGKSVSVPAEERPGTIDDDFKDDKIIPAPPTPKPTDKLKAYTGAEVKIIKAQYNKEMFPEQYEGDNKFGLYKQPNQVGTFNRRSKIWFDVTPFKGGNKVLYEEGKADGILWDPVFHVLYNGVETVCKADKSTLQDTVNGAGRPIQVILGDSVAFGFSSWDYTYGFVPQIHVGDNEGDYEVWVEFPLLGITSNSKKFSVS